MKKLILLIIVALSLNACIVVDESIIIPKYAVYSILCPTDSLISVFVGKVYEVNQSFPTDTGKYISSAKVFISNSEKKEQLIFNRKTKRFELANKGFLESNKQYFLEVNIDNTILLKAKTTIPDEVENVKTNKEINENDANVIISWQDSPQNTNFYKLEAKTESSNLGLYLPFNWEKSGSYWRTNDVFKEGKIINSPYGTLPNLDKVTGKIGVLLTVFNMEKLYFDFDKKIESVQLRDTFTEKFESPIILESNIENGLGLFSSYTKKNIFVSIK
jgi:hypothetical protein